MPSELSFLIFPKSAQPALTRHGKIYELNPSLDPDAFARAVRSAADHPDIEVSFHWHNSPWAEERDSQTIMAVIVLKREGLTSYIEAMKQTFIVKEP